jgi:putative PIN family toxin of toxin-antitoxin system
MSLRVVIDTNIVLSALLFKKGRLSWIRHAWQNETITPIVCRETAAELIRVLTYPKFKLTTEDQEELLADFLPWAEVVTLPKPWPDIPECRDAHDNVFLALARFAEVEVLVTGDNDLLTLRDGFHPPILTAEELNNRLNRLQQFPPPTGEG